MPFIHDSSEPESPSQRPPWRLAPGTSPQDDADAIWRYCDRPGNAGRTIEFDQVAVLPERRQIPLGGLVEALNIDSVEAASLATVVRDAFDYHGMPLRLVVMEDGGPPEMYMVFDQSPRPWGWENGFVDSRDAEFARNPGFYPEPRFITATSLTQERATASLLAGW